MTANFARLRRAWAGAAALGFALGPLPASAASSWSIDPARTHIEFAVDSVGFPRTEGTFHKFEGRIAVDLVHPERSRVDFHVATASADVGSPSFSDYVRNAFLNAARYPSIDFASTSVTKLDDRTVRVTGDLTMLGVTQPMTIDVAVKRETGGGRERFGFAAQTRIDRLAFGMNAGFPLVSNDVDLKISTEAIAP